MGEGNRFELLIVVEASTKEGLEDAVREWVVGWGLDVVRYTVRLLRVEEQFCECCGDAMGWRALGVVDLGPTA